MSSERRLGLWSATALVVANMIGVGVFTTSGFLLGDLGTPHRVIVAWFCGGIIATLGALSYGALARRIPESGGEYIFLSRTLHPVAGYVAGWLSLIVGFSAPLATAAFAFGEYTRSWLEAVADMGGTSPLWAGTALLVLFSIIHSLRVTPGAWVQNAAVAIKVGLILGFIILAWGRIETPEITSPPELTAGAFAMSLVWISFSYSGWNAAVYIGGEVRNPERNLPGALLLGTGIVMVLYLGLNWVFVNSAAPAVLAGQAEVGRLAAGALGGRVWADAVTGIVALALMSSVSSMVMAGPRVYAQMARDGYLPRWFRGGNGPPRASIALQFMLALVLLWTASFETLLTLVGFTLSLSTAATVLGLIRLKLREPEAFPVFGWPWVPGLFLISVGVICVLAFLNIAAPAWRAMVDAGGP